MKKARFPGLFSYVFMVKQLVTDHAWPRKLYRVAHVGGIVGLNSALAAGNGRIGRQAVDRLCILNVAEHLVFSHGSHLLRVKANQLS